AYSETTKNALIAIKSAVRISSTAFTRACGTGRAVDACDEIAAGRDGRAGGPSGPSYFAEVLLLRSSLADVPKVARGGGGSPARPLSQASSSIRAASLKSASVRPPAECVESV